MLRRLFPLLPLLAVAALIGCEQDAEVDPESLTTLEEEVSYLIGYQTGEQLGGLPREDAELDEDLIIAGLRAALRGDSLPFSPARMDSIGRAFQDTLTARQSARGRAESEAFLAEYAARDSVEQTESGLLIKTIEPGTGASPDEGDTVTVQYRGMLADSTVFDSSYERGQPAQFVAGQLIPGFNEALELMEVGGTYEIAIPPDLAYGMQPPPRSPIGPNAALVFRVELLDITEAE